jgi:hypothetical protein
LSEWDGREFFNMAMIWCKGLLKNNVPFVKGAPPILLKDGIQMSWHTQEGAEILQRGLQG